MTARRNLRSATVSAVCLAPVLAVGCGGGAADREFDGGGHQVGGDAGDRPADAGGASESVDAGATDDVLAERPYELFVPEDAPSPDPAPLIILLHGYGASGDVQVEYFGLLEVAEERGIFVAYPDGLRDDAGRRFWNATDACCDLYGSDVDDVAYLTAVLDDIQDSYDIDPKRVYVVGHSNGGFMAHRLACERADRIAAIVSLAGATWDDGSACQPSEPVAVVQVHGTLDSTILYDGGEISGRAYPSAVTTVTRWAELNECAGELESTGRTLDLDSSLPGSETRVDRYSDCPEVAGDVELWTVEDGGHIPPLRKPAWPEAVAEFLLAHPKR